MRPSLSVSPSLKIIIDQIDMLQAMAVKAGDMELARELSVILANTMYRHFDALAGEGGTGERAA